MVSAKRASSGGRPYFYFLDRELENIFLGILPKILRIDHADVMLLCKAIRVSTYHVVRTVRRRHYFLFESNNNMAHYHTPRLVLFLSAESRPAAKAVVRQAGVQRALMKNEARRASHIGRDCL